MSAWLDWLWPRLALTAALALLLSGLFALLLIGVRQPARRVLLARVAILWLLLVPAGLAVRAPLWRAGLAAVPLVPQRNVMAGVTPYARRAITAAYLGGMGFALGWLALGGIALRRAVRRAHPGGPALDRVLGEVAGSSAHGLRLRLSPDLSRPIVAGLFRPVLLLPSAFADPDYTEGRTLRLALAHELSHCRRGDPPFSTLGQLASALWFFLPPVRWIERQMRRDQEFLADRDAADRLGGDPLPYASALLALAVGGERATRNREDAEPTTVSTTTSVRHAVASSCDGLVARMAMLLRSPFPLEAQAPWWYRGGFVVACGLGAILALTGPPATSPAVSSTGTRPVPPVQQFSVHSLVLERPDADRTGTDLQTVLPVSFPRDFDFHCDVDTMMCDRLVVELAGSRLVMTPQGAPDASGMHRWTRLRFTRRPSQGPDRAWVDGQPVPLTRVITSPRGGTAHPPAETFPLRFRGVDRLSLRNLALSW